MSENIVINVYKGDYYAAQQESWLYGDGINYYPTDLSVKFWTTVNQEGVCGKLPLDSAYYIILWLIYDTSRDCVMTYTQ